MAKLRFFYSTMNAGKSAHLLQTKFNFQQIGRITGAITHTNDTRFDSCKITSRTGLSCPAASLSKIDCDQIIQMFPGLQILFIDEVQFFDSKSIHQLCKLVDDFNIEVCAYGLRTNSNGYLFEGSKELFTVADSLIELKTFCQCGRKATHVLRYDGTGNLIRGGAEICIGDAQYRSVCRKCWIEQYENN